MRTTALIVAAIAVIVVIAAVKSRTQERQQARINAQLATDQTELTTLKIPDMFCSGCEVGVRIAANKVDGVKAVRTDSDKRIAEVTFDGSKTTAQAIATAITKATGFKTDVAR